MFKKLSLLALAISSTTPFSCLSNSSSRSLCEVAPPSYVSLGFSRVALGIVNNLDTDIYYYWSSKDWQGQKRLYQRTVSAHTGTWGWTWINGLTKDCIELEAPHGDGTSSFEVVVISNGTENNWCVTQKVFNTFAKSWSNPNWNSRIWTYNWLPILWYDGINYHSEISFNAY